MNELSSLYFGLIMYKQLLFLFNSSKPAISQGKARKRLGKNNSHQKGWQIPGIKVNDKHLQTGFLVYIFDDIILSVNAS